MKVDELIEKLQKLRSKVGNVDIVRTEDCGVDGFVIIRYFDVFETYDYKGDPYIAVQDDYT